MSKKLQQALIGLFSIIALLSGYKMYSLVQAEELWGHLPLFLFTSLWAIIVLSIGNRYSKHPKNWRWLGLSTLSGILLSVGFPPIPLTIMMFVGFVPLLMIEKEIADESPTPSKRLLLRYAYNAFVIWNILTTWWVGNTAFVAGIVAIWLNALFMCIPILLFHQTKNKVPRVAYAAFVAYWLSFELLHLNWEISWVWLNLGNAFAEFPSWVQWYEYTGTFGGSLWILLSNVLLFKALSPYFYKKEKPQTKAIVKASALIILPILASFVVYFTYTEKGEGIEVIVGQPNYEPHFEKFTINKNVRDQQVLDLAMNNITPETEYFILPETVFNSVDEDKPQSNKTIKRFQKVLNKFPKVKIVSGASAYNILKDNEANTPSTRTTYEKDGSIRMRYEGLNAAVQLQKDQPIQFYRKSKFVPGAELLPYKSIFFFLEPLVDKLDGSMEGLGTQPYRTNFSSTTATVAPVICYESVFGAYHTEYIRNRKNALGADFIAIMTNDGWWDNTAGHKQHLAFASLRAIETRRDIARSANTGISAFINQRGDIISQTKYNERTTLKDTVHLNKEITFYTLWKDLIARLALFTAMILLLQTLVKGKLPERK